MAYVPTSPNFGAGLKSYVGLDRNFCAIWGFNSSSKKGHRERRGGGGVKTWLHDL